MESASKRRASLISLNDIPDAVTSRASAWKQQALDTCYCELKIRFPITAEMLVDIQELLRREYPQAEEAFHIDILRQYRHPHRWKPLLKYSSACDALVHAVWNYTINTLAACREHKTFRTHLVKTCLDMALDDISHEELMQTINISTRRNLVKQLVEV